MNMEMNVPGYESLRLVLQRAYNQAALDKGAERHANNNPFHEQPMQTIAAKRGIGFLLGQADKKSEEAQGMVARGETDRAVHELLGAINYIAGAIVYLEKKKQPLEDIGANPRADAVKEMSKELNDIRTGQVKSPDPTKETSAKPCNCSACSNEIPPEVQAMAREMEKMFVSMGLEADVSVGVIRL